ncbi:hypothetical protein [Janthinobacterium sp. AD80]|uniref:hypothetical protein n=1 Tax=Janthinobacterium sp. AD80 TaxID=1528773 RepID=UPI000C8415A6|nr:hypothetical protein [Janthinobacterium sp. AD80]PMQ17921.1 hypothetical protein JaAD80_02985 [Janthinobacterium sp. AD80]
MKNRIISCIVIAASTLATAQVLPPERTVEVPALSLRITPPAQPRYISREDFQPYAGEYTLANGQPLRLRQYGGLLYAKVGDGEEHRIVAATPNLFVALDRKLKVRIDRRDDGTLNGELVMMVTPQRMADGSMRLERVAALPIAAR